MIKNISVIGAGTMGHAIASVFAIGGYSVKIQEPFEQVRIRAIENISSELDFMIREGLLNAEKKEETLSRISVYESLEMAVSDADYVIEACPEKLEIKQKLFLELNRICKPDTIFATNTSSLRFFDIISVLPKDRQKKCLVCHWYNPPYLIPIAELSKFGNMNEEDYSSVFELYVNIGKRPITVLKDIDGMVANRLLHAQAREAFSLYESGIASAEDIDNALKYGPCFRAAAAGILQVADMGGLDIWYIAENNLFPVLSKSDKACDAMEDLVQSGNLGIKSGKGFFDYSDEKAKTAYEDFNHKLVIQLKASKNY